MGRRGRNDTSGRQRLIEGRVGRDGVRDLKTQPARNNATFKGLMV